MITGNNFIVLVKTGSEGEFEYIMFIKALPTVAMVLS